MMGQLAKRGAAGFYPRIAIVATAPLPAHFRKRNGARRLIVVRPEEVAWMVRQLSGRGWVTATQLGAKSGSQKRKLKAIVHAAAGEILHFRGAPGFKLISGATRSQILRGIATLRAEAHQPMRLARHYLLNLKARTAPVTGDLFVELEKTQKRRAEFVATSKESKT